MGSYHPHRHIQRRPRRTSWAAQAAPTLSEDTVARREQIAREREQQARRETEKRERMAARREQRASDALRADARSNLEARARTLFPWDLMAPDRKIAALLTGQPRGSLFPIFELAQLFAGVNCGVSPEELGVSGQAANFVKLSAPRTRSWPELARAADFFIEAQTFEGRALDRTALLDKARRALADLEARLSALPDWLTVHELRRPWFIIRPTPETAAAMWTGALASKSAAAP
jgi:hypothetical protein